MNAGRGAFEQYDVDPSDVVETPDEAVPVSDLRANVAMVNRLATRIFNHAGDSDDPIATAQLLADLRDAKQALGLASEAVEANLVTCADGAKTLEVDGVGVIEIRKHIRRTDWRHTDLWRDVIVASQEHGYDPLAVLADCCRPAWRLTDLRKLGVEPDDYCRADFDGYSVSLPSRKLEERGEAF